MEEGLIQVEVAFARPDRQVILTVAVPASTTIDQAIKASGIALQFPEIEGSKTVGVFGQQRSPEDSLREGDRIEIYRPLLIDPREARRGRALKK